jgi:hypothetical protein
MATPPSYTMRWDTIYASVNGRLLSPAGMPEADFRECLTKRT